MKGFYKPTPDPVWGHKALQPGEVGKMENLLVALIKIRLKILEAVYNMRKGIWEILLNELEKKGVKE